MYQSFKVSHETLKLLEENKGETFHDVGIGNDFMVRIPKA
jgi:hypothetical protein